MYRLFETENTPSHNEEINSIVASIDSGKHKTAEDLWVKFDRTKIKSHQAFDQEIMNDLKRTSNHITNKLSENEVAPNHSLRVIYARINHIIHRTKATFLKDSYGHHCGLRNNDQNVRLIGLCNIVSSKTGLTLPEYNNMPRFLLAHSNHQLVTEITTYILNNYREVFPRGIEIDSGRTSTLLKIRYKHYLKIGRNDLAGYDLYALKQIKLAEDSYSRQDYRNADDIMRDLYHKTNLECFQCMRITIRQDASNLVGIGHFGEAGDNQQQNQKPEHIVQESIQYT